MRTVPDKLTIETTLESEIFHYNGMQDIKAMPFLPINCLSLFHTRK